MTNFDHNPPKVSIGLPVYNGEKFIKKKIESLLNQTFGDFELIISDNGSTDQTAKICEEFSKSDKRIHLFHQNENIGIHQNFDFVLQKACSKYFMWAAADDILLPTFMEKNFNQLENNPYLVGCVSKNTLYRFEQINENKIDDSFAKFRKKIIGSFRTSNSFPLKGSYEKRVRDLFKKSAYNVFYGIFKTESLHQSFVYEEFVGMDAAILLNVLRYGDIETIDENLMERYDYGDSTKGSAYLAKYHNKNRIGKIFPHAPFTLWAIRNLGTKIFLKNLDHFLLLNIGGEILFVMDFIRILINKIK